MAHGPSRSSPPVQTPCLLSRDALLRAYPRGKLRLGLDLPEDPAERIRPSHPVPGPGSLSPGSPGGVFGASGARRSHMSSGQRAVTCDLARGLARAALLLLQHVDLSGRAPTPSPPVAACGDGSERRAEAPGSQGPRGPTASSAPPDPDPAPTPAGCSGDALSRRPEHRVPKGQRDAEAPVRLGSGAGRGGAGLRAGIGGEGAGRLQTAAGFLRRRGPGKGLALGG